MLKKNEFVERINLAATILIELCNELRDSTVFEEQVAAPAPLAIPKKRTVHNRQYPVDTKGIQKAAAFVNAMGVSTTDEIIKCFQATGRPATRHAVRSRLLVAVERNLIVQRGDNLFAPVVTQKSSGSGSSGSNGAGTVTLS